ncbi:MAG TPA: alcohol dehydrogenase, partial [Chthoniobacteraceae bacterium]|nr:alcohol dehydrogenase [Chthoniobacteraceae bacterium]
MKLSLYLLLSAASMTVASFHASALDWPQYRGPASDGRTSEKVIRPWTSAGPKRVWKVSSEGGFSSFAVSSGRAFTLSLKEAEGVRQESLVALDANT